MKKPFPVKTDPVAPADVASVESKIADSDALMSGTNIEIPKNQKNAYPLSGFKKEGTVMAALQIAKDHPGIFPPTFSVANFEIFCNNRSVYNHLRNIAADFFKKMDDSYVSYGILESDATNNVYAYLKMAAASDPSLEPALEQLEKFYAKGPRKAAVEFSVTHGGNVDVDNCTPGTPVTNTGAARLALNAGGHLTPGVKRVATLYIEPNTSVKIPTSYTSINVSNLSSTDAGSFTVKAKP